MPKFNNVEEINEILNTNVEELPPETQQIIGEKMGMMEPTPEEQQQYNDLLKAVNPSKEINTAFKNAGFHEHAHNRQNVGFMVYLMGVKKISFSEAIKMVPGAPGFEAAMSEFHKFLVEHPVMGEGVDVEKNVGVWTQAFMDASDKLDEYTLPDIDYGDPEQIKPYMNELMRLSALQIDFSQEFDRVVTGERRSYAIKKAGDSALLADKIDKVNKIQDVLIGITNFYNNPQKSGKLKYAHRNNDRFFEEFARHRLDLSSRLSHEIRGKKVGDITGKPTVEDLYKMQRQIVQPDFKFQPGEAKEFFVNGKLSPERQKEYDKALKKADDAARQDYNDSFQYAEIKSFTSGFEVQYKKGIDVWNNVFDVSDNPAELIERLGKEENKQLKSALKSVFNDYLNGNTKNTLYRLMGINGLDTIRIDGKTPEQLWGEQAKVLNSQADKELYYQTMILKEAWKGDGDISCDAYMIDKNHKVKKAASVKVIKSKKSLEKEAAVFKQIAKLHNDLQTQYDELTATGEEGHDEYNAMMAAYKDALKASDLSSPRVGTMQDLEDSLKKLETTSKEYHRTHTGFRGMFKAHFDEGKLRLNKATHNMNNISYEIEKLRDLYVGQDFVPYSGISRNGTKACFMLDRKWDVFKGVAKQRGINVSNASLLEPWPGVDEIVSQADKKDAMRREVMKAYKMQGSTKTQNLESSFGEAGGSITDCAKKATLDNYLRQIRYADKGQNQLKVSELETEIMDPGFAKKFNSEVDDLISNDTFRETVTESKRDPLKKWVNKEMAQRKEKHRLLSGNNKTYKMLKAQYPNNFDIRWETAEIRLAIWKQQWERTDLKQELASMKENAPLLNDHVQHGGKDDFYDKEAENVKEGMYDKFSKLLTDAILKDNYQRHGHDYVMEVAIAPDNYDIMQQYIKEGLQKDGCFASKGMAAKTLNDFTNMKRNAIEYVREGQHRKLNAQNQPEAELQANGNKVQFKIQPKKVPSNMAHK